MIRENRFVIIWLFSALMTPTSVSAQASNREQFCDIVSSQFDNDEFGGSDRHYTAGFRLACNRSAPSFLDPVTEESRHPDDITNSRATYSIGQGIFTPDDISESELIEDDQPYAGWLYLGFALEKETVPKDNSQRFLDTAELQVGVIGPLSGA